MLLQTNPFFIAVNTMRIIERLAIGRGKYTMEASHIFCIQNNKKKKHYHAVRKPSDQ